MSFIQKLESTSTANVANLPEVAERFQKLYALMNGKDDKAAVIKYESEKFHFMKLIKDKPDLQKCTGLSLYGCFLDMAVSGLSFDPAMKHAYIVPFPTKVVKNSIEVWEHRASVLLSGYGELIIRTQQKQIKYADNPILIYQGDKFKHGTKDGKVFLEHEALFPRESEEIIGCYIRLERIDGSVDYKVLSIGEVMKLKEFSKQKTSLAWTSGLSGMIQAKTIKHAFRSYPKIKLGQFSTLESDKVEEEAEGKFEIDYGINEPEITHAEVVTTPVAAKEIVADNNLSDETFMSTEKAPTATKVIEDDNF